MNGNFSFGLAPFEFLKPYKDEEFIFCGRIDGKTSNKQDPYNSIYDLFYVYSLFYIGTPDTGDAVLGVTFYPFFDAENKFRVDDLAFSFTGSKRSYYAIFKWEETVVMTVSLRGYLSDQIDKEKMFQGFIDNYVLVT